MEKLIVKDFIVLKDIEIDINKINIFIGQQATGKSLISKLLYYFKDSIWEIYRFIIKEDIKYNSKSKKTIKSKIEKHLSEKFIEYFSKECILQSNFYILYKNIDSTITVSAEDGVLKAELSDNYFEFINNYLTRSYLEESGFINRFYKQLKLFEPEYEENKNSETLESMDIRELLKFIDSDSQSTKIDTEHIFMNSIKTFFTNRSTLGKNQIFIPSGRSFFSILESNIFSLLSSNSNIDPFVINFGALYENVKRIYFRKLFSSASQYYKRKNITCSNLIDILNCDLQKIDGKEYIITDSAQIPVNKASSGQQEALPLVLIINYLDNIRNDIGNYLGNSVYIEEPEAHLFPSSQKMIIENIMEVFNGRKKNKNQFFITTHSPYVLSTMNNLILLNTLKEKIPNEILKKEFPNIKSAVSFNDISAYYISNGKSQNIKCEETETIYGEQLDEISNKISIEFDKLLNLGVEYGVF